MRNEVNADLTGIESRDANGAGGFERTAFQDAFSSFSGFSVRKSKTSHTGCCRTKEN